MVTNVLFQSTINNFTPAELVRRGFVALRPQPSLIEHTVLCRIALGGGLAVGRSHVESVMPGIGIVVVGTMINLSRIQEHHRVEL